MEISGESESPEFSGKDPLATVKFLASIIQKNKLEYSSLRYSTERIEVLHLKNS